MQPSGNGINEAGPLLPGAAGFGGWDCPGWCLLLPWSRDGPGPAACFLCLCSLRVPAGSDASDTLPTTFLVQTLIYLPLPVSTFRLPHGRFF